MMEALIIGLAIVFSALGYITYVLTSFDSTDQKHAHD